jgi:hypothetical protein
MRIGAGATRSRMSSTRAAGNILVTIGRYTFAVARLACAPATQSISRGFNLLHGHKSEHGETRGRTTASIQPKKCLPATRRLTTNAHRDFYNSIDHILGMR